MELWADGILIVIVAMLIDRYIGDVPNKYHPLRWMGNLLDAVDRHIKNRTSKWCTLYGFLGYLLILLLFGGIALTITAALRYGLEDVLEFEVFGVSSNLGEILWIIVSALFLKVTFALFAFRKFCKPIQDDLREGRLDDAADKTQMMVNRKTRGMDEAHIASSCCETISENLVDSVISPLFYYGIFGLPGAIAFRCSNMMDAMWGRRTEQYNKLGHFPARLDDVLGFIPSRLSPLFVELAAWCMRIKGRKSAIRAALKEHKKTPSPNSGWPMTASAAALGVSFEKEGVYVMGEGPLPSIDDISRCYHLIELTSILFTIILVFPLCALLGVQVQVIVEDFILGLLGVE
jgi:adenosylcobinamide-phosphate synthase